MAKTSFARPAGKVAVEPPAPAKKPGPPKKAATEETTKPADPEPEPTPKKPGPPKKPEPVVADVEVVGPDEALTKDDVDLAPTVVKGLMQQPLGALSGELGSSDYAFPKLKLSQSVGPLAEAGVAPGSLVLGETIIWEDGCEEPEITILRAQKQLVEDLPYGSEEFPKIFMTAADAEAEGLTTEWGPGGEKPQVLPQLLMSVLIKQIEGVDPAEFTIEYNDSLYCLSTWRAGGVCYKDVMQTLTKAQRGRLENGLHTGSFKISAKKIKGKLNTFFVPVLEPGAEHDQEFIDFLVEHAG